MLQTLCFVTVRSAHRAELSRGLGRALYHGARPAERASAKVFRMKKIVGGVKS